MRFISRNSNLLIVLRPGLSAQPLTGTPAKPTISVRFKEGVAEVENEELIAMMLAHSGYMQDFISVEANGRDPYKGARQQTEPAHEIVGLNYGTPVSREIKGGSKQLPPELQKIVQDAAVAMAKEMMPGMITEALKGLVAAHVEDKKSVTAPAVEVAKPKGKPGRKPSINKPEPIEEMSSLVDSTVATNERIV